MTEDVPETAGEHPDLLYQEPGPRTSASADPDVLLDVPEVKVDRIALDVEDLRARVSLQADVLDLLRLHVGVDAVLGRVHLEIDGVDAQAMLKVRLDNVAMIIKDVLRTIDRNPELIAGAVGAVATTARDVAGQVPEVTRPLAGLAREVPLPHRARQPCARRSCARQPCARRSCARQRPGRRLRGRHGSVGCRSARQRPGGRFCGWRCSVG